jgi:hypothetical protein
MLDFFSKSGIFLVVQAFRNKVLGPPGEFSGVFGYLIENQYNLEHLKFASVSDK